VFGLATVEETRLIVASEIVWTYSSIEVYVHIYIALCVGLDGSAWFRR
jgi:hypothetical protein